MKRIALIVLIVVFSALFIGCSSETPTGGVVVCNKPYILVGTSCCLDSNNNNICDNDETKPVVNPPEEPTSGEPKTEFKMVKGDSVIVAGKTFRLIDFSIFQGKLETVVDVDGMGRHVYETQKAEIVNGLRITPISVDRLQTYIIVKIEPLKLNSDEYLLDVDDDKVILGKVVRMRNVQDDKGVLVDIIDGEQSSQIFIMPFDTKTADGLKVTNVESFYRTIKAERYAILKIVNA